MQKKNAKKMPKKFFFGGGVLSPGGVYLVPGGVLSPGGCLPRGVSAWGAGVCLGGSARGCLPRGVYLPRYSPL